MDRLPAIFLSIWHPETLARRFWLSRYTTSYTRLMMCEIINDSLHH